MRLKNTENRDAHVRQKLTRIAAELKELLDDLPGDLRAQVAIFSAISFVQLLLDHLLGGGRRSDPAARPIAIVPPREAP